MCVCVCVCVRVCVCAQFYGIIKDLPLNVHLLTLERLDHTHHLLRLEHQYPIDEAPLNYTVNVTLEVRIRFSPKCSQEVIVLIIS